MGDDVIEMQAAPWGAQQACPEEFDELYRTYAARVRALAQRRLAGRDLADDVVQETFLRAFRGLARFDRSRPAWPWLKVIATNVCIDLLRDGRCWREVPDETVADQVDLRVEDADPADHFVHAERRRSIVDALAAMNVRQRRVLLLRDLEGWRAEEVAGLDESTVDAVKSTLKRGRESFRHAYLAAADSRGLLGVALLPFGGLAGRARRVIRRAVRVAKAPAAVGLPVQVLGTSATVLLATGAVAAALTGGAFDGRPSLTGHATTPPAAVTETPTEPLVDASSAPGAGARPTSTARDLVGIEAGAGGVTAGVAATMGGDERNTLGALLFGQVVGAPEVSSGSFVEVRCDNSETRKAACDAAASALATPLPDLEAPGP